MRKCKSNVKIASIVVNTLAIVVISAILIGSTFAWFTDSAVSSGNKIQSGTLKVDLELLDRENGWVSLKSSNDPIFNSDVWEPGYTDIKILKIENEGTLALQWKAKLVTEKQLSELADVIDVYVLPSSTELSYPDDRSLDGYTKVGTLAEFIDTVETTTKGTLLAGEVAYLGIALQMNPNAGNEYQGLSLGGSIDVMIVATQVSSESDGFNSGYDQEASLDWTPVSSAAQLRSALKNRQSKIVLTDNIVVDDTFFVQSDANIDGNGYTISRVSTVSTFAAEDEATPFTGTLFTVQQGATLELTDIVLDGGANWTGNVDNVLGRGVENTGIVSTGSLIVTEASAHIILNEGAIVKNTDGVNAINLGTRIGATLTINGGEIINNNSGAGAIWGGGHITLNYGKINSNSSTGLAGAIRMVGSCNLTMNGGEISNNKAVTNGGAIYGYGATVYNFNGGEMSGNHAAIGGAMYTGEGSTINIKDGFKLTNNVANNAGAFRAENRTTINMTGGEISGNISSESPNWNGFYGWNPAVNISGGKLMDNITIHGGLTPTLGGQEINGVVNFVLSTTHNTCNLAEDFGTIKFTVNEGSNFAAFNLKPASTYVYSAGDEDKLVCLNPGYVTYYDETTNTFRLTTAE